jgi:hypothetical protein
MLCSDRNDTSFKSLSSISIIALARYPHQNVRNDKCIMLTNNPLSKVDQYKAIIILIQFVFKIRQNQYLIEGEKSDRYLKAVNTAKMKPI